jgi:hypothetical protein
LKTVMLNALGTIQERRMMAYEQIKYCRQRVAESPTDLLDRLRPLWEELGTYITPELQTIEYMSALRSDIQRDIERLPIVMRATIPAIEEQANIVWRRSTTRDTTKDDSIKNKGKRHKEPEEKSEGDVQVTTSVKRTKGRQFRPKKANKPPFNGQPRKFVCYKCGEPGHIALKCKNAAKPGSDPREAQSEKDKGKKS